MTERVFNFAAGPSMLPEEVLQRAGSEIMNYQGTGMSVMEMSHRSPMFQKIFDHTKQQFIELMHVPDTHEVLFMQGGGSTQFSCVPLNFISASGKADYAVTGNFSGIAAKEAKKYGSIHLSYDGTQEGFTRIPSQKELQLDPEASYFHYCANNTIYGTEWQYVPDTGNVPLVCDMSSDITSRTVDISRYALIYAGAQKNMAPAGVTVVIIRKDMAGHPLPITPLMMNYETMIKKDSMYNTPPCWQIYMLGLTMDWLAEQGGVEGMEKKKHAKAQLLYDALENSTLFRLHADRDSRSDMNVTFRTGSDELDQKFVAEAAAQGLVSLKGHRLTGGMRASIYNAMPMEGAEKLREFILQFDKENR
ncbi:MAG: 3-phosphoserine/phosphohydroxythreonine transaminase [Solobacterium sp.]|jgi:phosphoserine aminotransferase|nr:3-phosphoserine/phosphohydroxythreonine transaminase [Solobacterium sp.]MCH4205133.1 3-phosphoserine/phosphohydroxythreonine transaminase [Solobacterium sp.]MCH4226726.1 3-phosphoserine/phosphohydroxythreonine transaminase [Solobacterium sp.]MCH4281945.1 3-phosphoserine/phosphohydroxythreonine transaminase [Solobacterium sp.]